MGAFHKSDQGDLRDAILNLRTQRPDAHWKWLCDQLALAAERANDSRLASETVEQVLSERGVDASHGAVVGLAHHFNNLLMGVLGASRMAARSLDAADPARAYVEEIAAHAERGVALSAKLLDTSASTDSRQTRSCECPSEHAAHGARPETAAAPARATHILLVEDERLIRITLRHELQALGYSVECAADGNEAARLIQSRSEPIDLLLTDIVVPGPTGPQLAKLAREKWPTAQVVFMSAYPRDVLLQQGHIQAGQVTLEKPFTEEQLLVTLRAALQDV